MHVSDGPGFPFFRPPRLNHKQRFLSHSSPIFDLFSQKKSLVKAYFFLAQTHPGDGEQAKQDLNHSLYSVFFPLHFWWRREEKNVHRKFV